ncbi:response regulator transcription factor [Rhizobium sp. Leaf383]|uniref:response regulator transcription factor n=1 Tax=Rhizobium sp. Leaf383 TaxID=1736357 RepID=UPI000714BB90|nr:response regulator transcription factor [Rhizobium sp. Leaf383]KQS76412.1 LuxR family transcriptional regulator [Rhizobium sp. Leaf383]
MSPVPSTPENEPLAIVVDDDEMVREALENLLNSVGIETISYPSGRAVLEATLPDRPACIVLDVRMPGLSGLDVQRQLAKVGWSTPVVFLTGHGDIAMSVEAMKAGALDFLTKPVRDQTLIDTVSKAIAVDAGRRQSHAATRHHAELVASLTTREKQVLRHVLKGALNKQIAVELGITEITVKLHRSNMMKKLKAGSITALFSVWQSLPEDVRSECI